MELEPHTKNLLESFFSGRTCWRCGQPAVRYVRRRFSCNRHILHSKANVSEDCRAHRMILRRSHVMLQDGRDAG